MEIRVLTFAGCPNCDQTIRLVQEVAGELGLGTAVRHLQVRNESEAVENHFHGSPSVQIDGKDIEPDRRGDAPSFSCRLYMHEGRRSGVPPKEMIVEAIQEAQHSPG